MSTHALQCPSLQERGKLEASVVLASLGGVKKLISEFSIGLLGSTSAESDPRRHLPDFATLNAQSTRHGARPGPTLAPSCTGEPPACPAAERQGKTRQRREKFCIAEKRQLYTYCSNIDHTWNMRFLLRCLVTSLLILLKAYVRNH